MIQRWIKGLAPHEQRPEVQVWPAAPAGFRGAPVLDPARCTVEERCVQVCPSGAITLTPVARGRQQWQIDYGACVFCGRCQEACLPLAISLSGDYLLAAMRKEDRQATAEVREARPRRPPAPGESLRR